VIRPGRRVIDIQAGEFTLAASRGISSVAPLLQGLHRPTDDGLRPALKVESRPCRLRALLKRGLAEDLALCQVLSQEGLSQRAIARELGLSASKVNRNLYRAHQRLGVA
jgi:DNA-binding NarL/FixJ family response regulator